MCFHDSFYVWAADKHIQASVWKNSWFSPGISSRAVYWNSVPREFQWGCFIFPLPLEQHCTLCSCCKDLGCLESMSYNQCGQARKWGAFIIFCDRQPVVLSLDFSQQNKKLGEKREEFSHMQCTRVCTIPRQPHFTFLHTGTFPRSWCSGAFRKTISSPALAVCTCSH